MRHCVCTLNSEQTQTRFRAALNRLCRVAYCHVNENPNAFRFIDHNIIAIFLRGSLLNNFEKGTRLEPPKQPPPPSAHACLIIFFTCSKQTEERPLGGATESVHPPKTDEEETSPQ